MHCLFINLFHLWQLHPNINWVMAFGVALNGTLVQWTSTHNNFRCCKIAAIQPDSTLHWEIVRKRERESESYQTDRERSPKHMQHMNKIAFSKGVTKLSLNHKNTFRCLLVVRFSRVFCHSIVCVWVRFYERISTLLQHQKWTWHREVRNYRHRKYDSRQRNKSRSGNVHCICT